jgi:phosphotransferase system  glucose/maltose/N-acetylglucosamine-specific IIC component
MMLAVTIGIAFAMVFRPRNVLAMAVAFHIIRNNDQTLARAMAASLAKPEPMSIPAPMKKLLSKGNADE